MTKEEVKRTIKSGNSKAIALALKAYWSERISEKKIKPLEFYQPNILKEKNINEPDILKTAKDIFLD